MFLLKISAGRSQGQQYWMKELGSELVMKRPRICNPHKLLIEIHVRNSNSCETSHNEIKAIESNPNKLVVTLHQSTVLPRLPT